MYTGYIYVIKNKKNTKLYVGQTSKTISERFKGHIISARNYKDENYRIGSPILYRAMRKYGFENFYIEEIQCLCANTKCELREQLNECEMYYIKYYNSLTPNGYNCTIGGDYSSESLKVPVDKYTTDGNFLSSYESASEAIQFLDKEITGSYSHISECCKGELKTAYGFVWRFKGESFDKYNSISDTYVMVDQYDINGTFIKTYQNIIEPTLQYSNNPKCSNISSCCKGKYKTAYGYVWRYHGEPFDKYDIQYKKSSLIKNIVQLDDDYNYVRTYSGYSEVLEIFDISKDTIRRRCNDHKLLFDSYWFFEDDDSLKQYIN